jgi:hypothetical protein
LAAFALRNVPIAAGLRHLLASAWHQSRSNPVHSLFAMDFLPAMDGPVPWMIGCAVGACATTALLAYNYNRFFVQPPVSKAPTSIAKAAPGDKDALFVLYQGLSPIKGPSGSLSQFCLKVEAFLRVAKIPYKSKNGKKCNATMQLVEGGVGMLQRRG